MSRYDASSQSQSQSSQKPVQDEVRFPSDYLSCEDISAQSQKLTCLFMKDVSGIGFIDPTGETEDIPCGTKLELPLWLAKVLYNRHLIELEIPKGYSETFREILQADAKVVDLHKLGPDYYKFGQHILSLRLKDSDEIAKSLVSTFHQRFHPMLDHAMSVAADTQIERLKFQSTLDNMELELLLSGQKAAQSLREWESRTCEKVVANDMVSTLNKKKKAVVDVEPAV